MPDPEELSGMINCADVQGPCNSQQTDCLALPAMHYSSSLFVSAVDMIFFAGYEKLKMFGFYLHAAIDGGTNFILYSTVSTNKSAKELFRGFAQAVDCFGFPQRLRSDMAREAGMIGQAMLDNVGPGSFIPGPSTGNQGSFLSAQH